MASQFMVNLPQDISTKIDRLSWSFVSQEESVLAVKFSSANTYDSTNNTHLRIQNDSPTFVNPQVFLNQTAIFKWQ
jgi:hypothetical protein